MDDTVNDTINGTTNGTTDGTTNGTTEGATDGSAVHEISSPVRQEKHPQIPRQPVPVEPTHMVPLPDAITKDTNCQVHVPVVGLPGNQSTSMRSV